MKLIELYELYKLKKAVPTEEEINEIFKDLTAEDLKKPVVELPQNPPLATIPIELKEGDVIEIFPSVDGLEMYFLVWGVFSEENTIRLMLLSEFIEFATPKDVIVDLNGNKYIVQTDIFIDLPYESVSKLQAILNRKIFKIGRLSEEDLQKIDKVFFGETKGDGKFTTPTKGLFKREEAERAVKLVAEYIDNLEKIAQKYSLLKEFKERKEKWAASERERYTLTTEDFYAKYDSSEEILIIVPAEKNRWKIGKIFIQIGEKDITLYEGVLFERIPIYLPKEAYDWEILLKGLKLEVD